jgi:uncharacterized protein (DUF305 family)
VTFAQSMIVHHQQALEMSQMADGRASDQEDVRAGHEGPHGCQGHGRRRKFAEMMTEHHNGAIEMAKDEQKSGCNAAAKKLAGDVVKNQSAEVKQMQGIVDRL